MHAEIIATAVKSSQFTQQRQFLSGYPLGWDRKDCWRVRVQLGRTSYLSETVYSTEASAKQAAKRMGSLAGRRALKEQADG